MGCLGPNRNKHLYLLRLHDTLQILLFKYGGDSAHLPALAVVLLVLPGEQNWSLVFSPFQSPHSCI